MCWITKISMERQDEPRKCEFHLWDRLTGESLTKDWTAIRNRWPVLFVFLILCHRRRSRASFRPHWSLHRIDRQLKPRIVILLVCTRKQLLVFVSTLEHWNSMEDRHSMTADYRMASLSVHCHPVYWRSDDVAGQIYACNETVRHLGSKNESL